MVPQYPIMAQYNPLQESPGFLAAGAKGRDPSFSNINAASGNSVLQMKRKKIKELIMGGGPNGSAAANRANNYALNAIEKEDLQMEKRTLKLQNNIIKDENTRLKTKLTILQ